MVCEVIRSMLNIVISFLGFYLLKNINPIYILAIALFISYLIPTILLHTTNGLNKVSLEKKEYQNLYH